jgi:hypothetical protein
MPKFDVTVKLIGRDGNALSIVGAVSRALREAGVTDDDIAAYRTEALSGDYNHLLNVTADTVHVE